MEWRKPGLINKDVTCYMNVVIQCLLKTPSFYNYLLSTAHSKRCLRKYMNCMTCAMHSCLTQLRKGLDWYPKEVIEHVKSREYFNINQMQDAHEFLTHAITAIHDEMLQGHSQQQEKLRLQSRTARNPLIPKQPVEFLNSNTTAIRQMFGGIIRSRIICGGCHVVKDQDMFSLEISLNIDESNCRSTASSGPITLEDCMAYFMSRQEFDGDNKYRCEGSCNGSMQRAVQQSSICSIRGTMVIQLQRFGTQKLTHAVRFPFQLNIGKFTSDYQDEQQRRREMWRNERKRPERLITYKNVWYRLYAVIEHLGMDSHGGHYVCYAMADGGHWYSYNDTKTKQVDEKYVLTRQAYLLFYKRCESEGQTEEEDSEDYDKEERENKEERARHFARFRAHMKERPSVKICEENFLYEHAIVSDCVL